MESPPNQRCCSAKEEDEGRSPSCTDEDGGLPTVQDDGSGDRVGDGGMELSTDQKEEEAAADITPTATFLDAMLLPLVMEKLLSFLSWEGMKVLMLAHPGLLPGAVRHNSTFSKRIRLDISNGEVIQRAFFGSHHWRHLAVELTAFPLDETNDEMDHVESLTLYLPYAYEPFTDPSLADKLEEILKMTLTLRTLRLEGRILNEVQPDLDVQHILSQLESVDIISFRSRPEEEWRIRREEITHFPNNILREAPLLKLKSISFWNVVGHPPTISAWTGLVAAFPEYQFLVDMVSNNKEHLEELKADTHVWKFPELKEVSCPKLKHLTISATLPMGQLAVKPGIVEAFLLNQPPLESLDISLSDDFPTSILEVLEDGRLEKMRKLHLKYNSFGGEEPYWGFLEGMEELRDFGLRKVQWKTVNGGRMGGAIQVHSFSVNDQRTGNHDEMKGIDGHQFGDDIVDQLPPQVEKILVQGVTHFWREPSSEGNNSIGNILFRFENLKEVDLLRSGGAVTDQGLQDLIANCPKLTRLSFSDCPDVSKFGISGMKKDSKIQTGRSLKELKGLRHLAIRSCANVSRFAMISAIQFTHLQSFDFQRFGRRPGQLCKRMRKLFLYIGKNNPSLEKLVLHPLQLSEDPEAVLVLKRRMKSETGGNNPNVKFCQARHWGETEEI